MLGDIIDRVDGNKRTLKLYNVDVDDRILRDIAAFFEPQLVDLRRASTDDGFPRNFAVLHDDAEFLGAAGIETLAGYLSPETGLQTKRLDQIEYPDILTHVDDTTFTGYGKRRMMIASREIEDRAWRTQSGSLHAGFQQLSTVLTQTETYRRLASSGIDVHVYGQPDRSVSDVQVGTVHASPTDEIGSSWFVVFDGDDEDLMKAALLAQAVGDDVFSGFWTEDPSLVDDILTYLERTYPA
ncbi:putative sensor protein, containd DICT domain [Halanaeroarchaeum sp. HSR-CO]|uniref:DICT sensory domain-containing protein n=1 Tax=Halanaeroarchaeum sp. HSR-CO TaxID=2866382 RepID=UPI00217E5C27|nr:DICT sensory domain-containing protein [Halanaeroarchaeum sp. HSR-CO]UWG47070.1 putative sensor protein, containd DICT domain [Halanaeroarchaeum sp. HSR-CO]